MNNQKRIEVLEGLKQAALNRELNGDEGVYYRQYDGCMCAVGYLLKESGFDPEELGRFYSTNVFGVPDKWRDELERYGFSISDASHLQNANDSNDWEKVAEMAEEAKSKVPDDDLT